MSDESIYGRVSDCQSADRYHGWDACYYRRVPALESRGGLARGRFATDRSRIPILVGLTTHTCVTRELRSHWTPGRRFGTNPRNFADEDRIEQRRLETNPTGTTHQLTLGDGTYQFCSLHSHQKAFI